MLRLSKHVLSLVEGYERGEDHALPIRHLGHPPHSPNPPAIPKPREESGTCPLTDHFSSSPGTELGACRCALAHLHAPIHPSPSPLMALRERGIKGVRVPPGRRLGALSPLPQRESTRACPAPRHGNPSPGGAAHPEQAESAPCCKSAFGGEHRRVERGQDHALPIRHLGHLPHSPNPLTIPKPREESGGGSYPLSLDGRGLG